MTTKSTRWPVGTGFLRPKTDDAAPGWLQEAAQTSVPGVNSTTVETASVRPPVTLGVRPATIPAALKALPQWLCWRLSQRKGQLTKPPFDAKTGNYGKSNDPATWSTFETAFTAYQRGGYAGIGFAFADGDGLAGVDLDHVIDLATDEVDPRALEILEHFKGTYCETSPSGTGFRIFSRGRPGRPGKNEGRVKWLEVYDHTSARYLTVTGHHWQGTAAAVTEQQAALDWLHAQYFAKAPKAPPYPPPTAIPLNLDDAELLEAAQAAANGARFRTLWNGDTSTYGDDHSAADLALCSLLAFWTGRDAGRIDRLFRQSGLMRPKWERQDYRQRTIDKAIAECREVYTGGLRARGNGPAADPPERELPPITSYVQDGELQTFVTAPRRGESAPGRDFPQQPTEEIVMSTIDDSTLKAGKAAPAAADGKPVIDAIPGKLPIVVHQAEQALITTNVPIFQRVGVMVRPAILPVEVQIDGVIIPAGSLVIEPVTKTWLAGMLSDIATWRKHNERQKGMVQIDCPLKYAEHYLAKKGEWNIRVLTGIIEAPTLRRDGSLLIQPGYDAQSGIYLNYTGQPVTVPDNPTRTDALKALDVLKEPFEEFPFVAEVDRSVALSGLLTAITRRSLRTAPYHAADAPGAGSGKGLLVDACALVATGRPATTATLGADEAETEKRLSALLMRGVSIINLDNAARPVEGDFICSLATQETVDPRVLGQSVTVTIPSNTAAIFLTGNNLVFRGDMTRRVLLSRIDPRCERPDAREFKRNLRQFVTENRHHLLSAALTVLRAFVCAGKPAHGKGPYGSFEEWDGLVRGALLWLGQPDPLDSRERIIGNDPAANSLRALLATWFEVFNNQSVTVHEVIDAATPDQTGTYPKPKGEELRHVLLEVAGQGGVINSRIFGRYLSKNTDRIAGGYRLEQVGARSGVAIWRVQSTEGGLTSGLSGFRGFLQPKAGKLAVSETEVVGNAKNIGMAGTNPRNPLNPPEPTPADTPAAPPPPGPRRQADVQASVARLIASGRTPWQAWQEAQS